MTEETETIDEIREWRRSRRSAGHNSESDLLALGRLVEKRWLEDEARAKRKRDMAEGTAAIQRLDYSKPPPGYLVHAEGSGEVEWGVTLPGQSERVISSEGYTSKPDGEDYQRRAAWAWHDEQGEVFRG